MKSMLFAMAFVLSACSAEVAGHKVIDTGGQSKEDYSYEYTENGCLPRNKLLNLETTTATV